MKTYRAIYFVSVLIAVTFSNSIFSSVVFAFTIFNLIDVTMKIWDERKMYYNIKKRIRNDKAKERI